MPYFWWIALVVLADQATKWVVQTRMRVWQSTVIVKNWFSLTYVTNYGAAFSILESRTLVLILIGLGVFITAWYNRKALARYPRILQFGLAVALGGAAGNFIDRIRLGYVVDFIDFHFWPVFNIADIGIVLGVALVGWGALRDGLGNRTKSAAVLTPPDNRGDREEK